MLFYLETLNLARLLIEDAPNIKDNEINVQIVQAAEAWKHSMTTCTVTMS